MTVSNGLGRLATAIETLESHGVEVRAVATDEDDLTERLDVDLTLSVPLEGSTESGASATDAANASVTGGEDAHSGASTSDLGDPKPEESAADRPAGDRPTSTDGGDVVGTPGSQSMADADVDRETPSTRSGRVGADDAVACPVSTCDETFESEHGMKIHRTKIHRHQGDDGDDGDVPDYRNPQRLREVYGTCDSFTAMRDALETDVSAQTVRRQMIAHGIYDPDTGTHSNGDGEDGGVDAAEGAARDDADDPADIELPEGYTVATLKSAVCEAKTLYDVQQTVDLDREETMALLERYDLLGLVHGRVSNRDERKDVDESEVTRRILERAPVPQAPGA